VRDLFSADKEKELNISQEEIKILTDVWTKLELNNLIRALRPKSFREGKAAFDSCLETGCNIWSLIISS